MGGEKNGGIVCLIDGKHLTKGSEMSDAHTERKVSMRSLVLCLETKRAPLECNGLSIRNSNSLCEFKK